MPSLPWFLYYGRLLGMSKSEIIVTTVGEMQDMMACYAISNGLATEKKKRHSDFDAAIAMR